MAAGRHWVDQVVGHLLAGWGDVDEAVCNAGLSVSGLQHVGRLRGEITITNVIRMELERLGKKSRHNLVLYTQDPWKGKETQLKQFRDPEEARNYIGWRLIDVPDPKGCHGNWFEHYWEDFGNHLEDFAHDVQTCTTTALYKEPRMRAVVKELIEKDESVRQVLNKYRGRKPYPEGWVPIEPLCPSCRRLGKATAVAVDLNHYTVDFTCKCGYGGRSGIEEGKPLWRLEWAALWKALKVCFEPYGKDLATKGGSRDSAVEIAETILGIRAPVGLPYEWVGYVAAGKDLGDMGSSDFVGFTPRDWLKVAEPEALRYHYLVHDNMKRLTLSLDQVYHYIDLYDRAERIYYGIEKPKMDDDQLQSLKRSYALAQLKPLPVETPFQLGFLHAVVLVQALPNEGRTREAARRLRATGLLKPEPTEEDLARVERRLSHAADWLENYAPETFKVKLLMELPIEVPNALTPRQKALIKVLQEELSSIPWTEEEVKNAMKQVTEAQCQSREEQVSFFEALYMLFFGQPKGPRIAPYLSMFEREWVVKRLREAVA